MNIGKLDFSLNISGKIHFIGIGGIGMSGLAEILNNLGFDVQGSDLKENDNVKRLKKYGINIFIGHNKSNIESAAFIVISSDVKDNNIEVIEAKKQGIPIVSRAEMLAEILRFKYSVAISGSHGKTTTTSLIANMFDNANLNPTVITGGIINSKKTNAYLGEGKYLIVEADESDGTFIKIPAFIGVVTNIDPEHLNYYGDFETLKEAFVTFIHNLPFYGFAVLCVDHKTVREVAGKIQNREILTYSCLDDSADIYANNIRYTKEGIYYDVYLSKKLKCEHTKLENIFLPMFGDHNVLNSLAAIAVGTKLGFTKEDVEHAFKGFEGVKRRFTFVGDFEGTSIVDDYAHHPEEIKVTIKTARKILESNQTGKLIAVVQPHRYSRVENLMQEFANCYDEVDVLYLTDIYSAGESPIEGISSESLSVLIKQYYPSLQLKLISSYDNLVDHVYVDAKQGDILLMMGAGTITKWAADLKFSLDKIGKSSEYSA